MFQFPDQGGDNYRVVASTTRKPDNVDDPRTFENGLPAGFVDVNTYLPPNAHRSGVLEAWRQIYYERDFAPVYWDRGDQADRIITAWDIATETVAQGSVTVLVRGDASALAGQQVFLMDGTRQDTSDVYGVVDAVVAQDGATTVVTLDRPLVREVFGSPDPAFCDGQVVVAGTPFERILPESHAALEYALAGSLERGFVEFAAHPSADDHLAPAVTFDTANENPDDGWDLRDEARVFASYALYFNQIGQPNVLHVVEAHRCLPPGTVGLSHPDTKQTIVVCENLRTALRDPDIVDPDLGVLAWQLAVCTLVHEIGHHFDMDDWPRHTDHACCDGPSVDGCVMLYPSEGAPPLSNPDIANATALFGGPTAPPREPTDYKTGIGGHRDPLVPAAMGQ